MNVAAPALVIATILAGCATARPHSSTSADIQNYDRQSQAIAQRERECEAAAAKNDPATAAPAASSPNIAASPQLSATEFANVPPVAQCKAEADRETEQLASRQRVEYEQRARDERDSASLMEILTGSLQH